MDISTISLEIVIILILIIANGVFALTEMSIVSSKKARLEKRAEAGDKGAKNALDLAEDPTPMLSTIQIGITLIGILTGTFGGATLSKYVSEYLKTTTLAPVADTVGLVLVVSIITYLSLIIGELVPKRLALNNPEPIASLVAQPMKTFAKMAAPVVHFLTASTNWVLRLLGVKPSEEPPVTEDEIRILLEQGTEAGAFEKEEQHMIDRVFRLTDAKAHTLMAPRTQMTWLDVEDSAEHNLQIIIESTHNRFPVAKGDLDNFVGVLYVNDLLNQYIHEKTFDLHKIIREPEHIPESMKAFKILELFKKAGVHEALVIDEYGGVAGFITLHDILEELVGDMPLSNETPPAHIIQREDGTWLVDGLLSIEEFKEYFAIDNLPLEEKGYYHTVGGFIVTHFGRFPAASDHLHWQGYRFEVVDMDKARVDKVLVSRE